MTLVEPIQLNQIFIARERQLDDFQTKLERWLGQISNRINEKSQLDVRPSAEHRIGGLVVLVYGRGGFGKSTLLSHFYQIARDYKAGEPNAVKIVNWQDDLSDRERSLLNRPAGEAVESEGYFNLLHNRLAVALGKDPTDFKEYQKALEAVKKAREKGDKQLESLTKSDERYGWALKAGSEIVKLGLRTVSHGVINDKMLDSAGEITGKGVKIGATELKQLHDRLHDKLSTSLGDYLEPELRLGRGIGHDLAKWAKGRPLVIFFDTYEVADEADDFLRIVMGAAGERVGWVIAGRDNLWTNQGERNEKKGLPGYRDLVKPEYSLAINFDSPDEGNFSQNDLKTYFAELSQLEPDLPLIEDDEAIERVWQVTQGVPLAVSIAAGLYLETYDLNLVTNQNNQREEIVGQMVERYLLHTNSAPADRLKLYGLALLRRADHPDALRVALNLDAESDTATELRRLNRRYSFIFQARQPVLHQEVRYFMREWLRLERHRDEQILAINKRLYDKHLADLLALEEQQQFISLQERLENDRWFELYRDLAEQQFWLDPDRGVAYTLPLIMAAAIYRRDSNEETLELGNFFSSELTNPAARYWEWADDSLGYYHSRTPSKEELQGLEELLRLIEQRCPSFPAELKMPDSRPDLETALYWRRAEAWIDIDDQQAVAYYERALVHQPTQWELREKTNEAYLNLAYALDEQKDFEQALAYLNKCLELSPHYTSAYNNRGNTYAELNYYEEAIADFDKAIALDPNLATAYNNRGVVYGKLNRYKEAIADFDKAIALDPNFANAYNNRGIANRHLNCYEEAIADYDKAITLDSNFAIAHNNRGLAYFKLNRYKEAIADYDKAIAFDPNYTSAYNNRGLAYSKLNHYEEAIANYDKAITLNPTDAKAYYNRGIAYLLRGDKKQAQTTYEQTGRLDTAATNARWMAEWCGLGEERGGVEQAARLKEIARLDPKSYISKVCAGVALAFSNRPKEGLTHLEEAIPLKPYEWDAYFWQGLVLAYLGRGQAALAMLDKAMEMDLPPALLFPLHWLERDRPQLYRELIRPWLDRIEGSEKLGSVTSC